MENAVFINIQPPLFGVRSVEPTVLFVWQLKVSNINSLRLQSISFYQLSLPVLIQRVINTFYSISLELYTKCFLHDELIKTLAGFSNFFHICFWWTILRNNIGLSSSVFVKFPESMLTVLTRLAISHHYDV